MDGRIVVTFSHKDIDILRRTSNLIPNRFELTLAATYRARMLSHHAWDKSMTRLDGIIARCVSKFQNSHGSRT